MKISTFNRGITELEGKKVQVNQAQVNEVMKVANIKSKGEIYRVIREMPEEE